MESRGPSSLNARASLRNCQFWTRTMYISCHLRRGALKKIFFFVIAFGLITEGVIYFTCHYHSFRIVEEKLLILPPLVFNAPATAVSKPDLPSGLLNHHIWYGLYFEELEDLGIFPMFPKAPDNRTILEGSKALEVRVNNGSAQRIFGYLVPQESGNYRFSIVSDGVVHMWLATAEDDRQNARLVAFSGLQIAPNAQRIDLINGQEYFMEIIKITSAKESYLRLSWHRPGSTQPEDIDWQMFHPFLNDTGLAAFRIYDDNIPEVVSCSFRQTHLAAFSHFNRGKRFYVAHESVNDVLPSCQYDPSYNFHRKMSKWEAVSLHVVHTFRFPFPQLEALKDAKQWYFPLDESEAMSVVRTYMAKLEKAQPKRYHLLNVTNVERKEDQENGKRYLIEVELTDKSTEKTVTLSEYVFQIKGQHSLCYPSNFQWNRTSQVYLVVTSKNQGRWLHHFIKNVERILSETGDSNVHVVIFDYDSSDMDLHRVLRDSSITSYRVIKRPGRYSRTESFTEAINSIEDPHAIVFMLDLHLDIASSFIDDIRKHCIEGRSVYTPILVSLKRGALPTKPRGSWEVYGYGLIGLYKSDWDRVGGFPVQKHRWGGEDWELMDQLVGHGLEFERMRCPLLYHYHHSKSGMWGS